MRIKYFYRNKRLSDKLDELTDGQFSKELQKEFPRSLQWVNLDFSIGNKDDKSFIQISIDRKEIKTIQIKDSL